MIRCSTAWLVVLLWGCSSMLNACAAEPPADNDYDPVLPTCVEIHCNDFLLRTYIEDYFTVSMEWVPSPVQQWPMEIDGFLWVSVHNEEACNLLPEEEIIVSNVDDYRSDVSYDAIYFHIEPNTVVETGCQPFTIDLTLRCDDVLIPVNIAATPVEPAVEGEALPFEVVLGDLIRE